jgi:signal transduction histidine kinase
MSLRTLKLLTVAAPVVFVLGLFTALRLLAPALPGPAVGYALAAGLTLAAALVFSRAVFAEIHRLQGELVRQNRELLALHEAGLGVMGELDLETVLQTIVDEARELVGARYGALAAPGEGGGSTFLTSGMPQAGPCDAPPPADHGLLSVVALGERLRLADVASDPRCSGLPPDHVTMRSLLGVPVRSGDRILGCLYLSEKETGGGFRAEDEEVLARFATQAALAIENARLHREVRARAISEERERIAREMHDSIAQVLTYVNTKGGAALALLRSGRADRAEAQLEQLTRAARDAYADVREAILGLRASQDPQRGFLDTLGAYLDRWQEQSDVQVELEVGPEAEGPLTLPPGAELQLLRIVQEALANVRKHSRARHVRVGVKASDGWLEVQVEDDGAGFDPDALERGEFPRFGLAMMRERAEAGGGRLDLATGANKGTTVTARLPLEGKRGRNQGAKG